MPHIEIFGPDSTRRLEQALNSDLEEDQQNFLNPKSKLAKNKTLKSTSQNSNKNIRIRRLSKSSKNSSNT